MTTTEKIIQTTMNFRFVTAKMLLTLRISSNYKFLIRKLSALEKNGILSSEKNILSAKGRPEKLFTLSPKYLKSLNISHPIIQPSEHMLLINEFLTGLHGKTPDGLKVFYVLEHSSLCVKGQNAREACTISIGTASVVADSIITLEREGKKVILFLELDRGFEPSKIIERKLEIYNAFYDSNSQKFNDMFEYSFKKFRVLFITIPEKVQDFARIIQKNNSAFCLVSDFKEATKNPFGKVWTNIHGEKVSLVKNA